MEPFGAHVCSARCNGKTYLRAKLTAAVCRADVYKYVDHSKFAIHLVSMNKNAPLSDEEKRLIKDALMSPACPYEVVFDN